MELPNGFEVSQDNAQYCLQSIKCIHGQKQAGRTWAIHFKSVYSIGFVQSLAGNSMFFQCSTISVVYVDDVIIIGPQKGDIYACIQDMKGIFNHTDKGEFSNYLGYQGNKTY
jgi:Reverse transcriptase (RNA-dependent DNA polymerase)